MKLLGESFGKFLEKFFLRKQSPQDFYFRAINRSNSTIHRSFIVAQRKRGTLGIVEIVKLFSKSSPILDSLFGIGYFFERGSNLGGSDYILDRRVGD